MHKLFCSFFIILFIFIFYISDVQAQQTVGARNKYKIAKNMFYSGMYQDAEKELEAALKMDGHYADALWLMGLTKMALNKNEEAVECFRRVTAEQPKHYPARLYLANLYMSLNQQEKASEQIEYYITNMPADPNGHYAKGVLEYSKGNLTNAIKLWDKSISLNKDLPYPHYNRGIALFLLDKKDDAIKSIAKALELTSNANNTYRFTLGYFKYLTDKKDEAMKEFKYIAEAEQETVEGLTSSGFVLFSENKYDEALAKCDEAFKKNAEFTASMMLKAYILEKQNKYDEAIEACNLIEKADKNDKTATKYIEELKKAKIAYEEELKRQLEEEVEVEEDTEETGE